MRSAVTRASRFSTSPATSSGHRLRGASRRFAPVYLKKQQAFGGFDTNERLGKVLDSMMSKQDANYQKNPDIKWNFTKFLIDRKGRVVKRFEPTDKMSDVAAAVRALLKK